MYNSQALMPLDLDPELQPGSRTAFVYLDQQILAVIAVDGLRRPTVGQCAFDKAHCIPCNIVLTRASGQRRKRFMLTGAQEAILQLPSILKWGETSGLAFFDIGYCFLPIDRPNR